MTSFVRSEEQLVTEVFVTNLGVSIDFYRTLGFAMLRREGHFAELSWEGHLFFLDESPQMAGSHPHPQANIRIMVPDVDRYWRLAEQLRAPIISEIADRPYGLRDFILTDPDGFGLRFATPLSSYSPNSHV